MALNQGVLRHLILQPIFGVEALLVSAIPIVFLFHLQEDEGIAFRGLFVIDGNQKLRQITVNDLPVGRDVDETLRLVQVSAK